MSFYRIHELAAVTNGKERWIAIGGKHGTKDTAKRIMKIYEEKRPGVRFRVKKVVR